MANLSNINNKFLFTDGDFLKIGDLAPINNISGTESGISITNSNVASITLDTTAASGKRYVMYSSGNGSLVFWDSDAASARLQIDTSGNVGIGGSPNAKFSVLESTANTEYASMGSGSTVARHLKFSGFIANGTNNVGHRLSALNAIALNVAGDDALYIDNSGNVGIGETSLNSRLIIKNTSANDGIRIHTSDTSEGYLIFRDDSAASPGAIVYDHSVDMLSFKVNGVSDRVNINSSGNVGIGTTSPDTALEIVRADPILTIRDTETAGASTNSTLRLAESGASDTLGNYYDINYTALGALRFLYKVGTNIQERMRIDSSGLVSIKNVGVPTLRLDNTDTSLGANQIIGDIDFYQSDPSGQGVGVVSKIRSINSSSFQGEAGLAFYTGTPTTLTERMRINSLGNVGIQNTNPGALLDVGETIHANTTGIDVTGVNCIGLNTSDNHNWFPYTDGNNYYSANNHTFRGGTNNGPNYMVIDSSGNVGIGTTAPAQALQIVQGKSMMLGNYFFLGSGDSNYMGSIGFNRDTTNGNIFNSSYGAYQIHNYQGALKLQVYSSAGSTIGEHKFFNDGTVSFFNNVGIGTTNPQDKLHVSGDAIISSTRFGDFATASMNTTGVVVATVAASTNGQSAIVEFVASGNNGGYYNVVYSCYNGGGVWYYNKNVVGIGGNIEVAETNGSGSSTLSFSFRATSGSASYTPRVMMKGMPYNLVTF